MSRQKLEELGMSKTYRDHLCVSLSAFWMQENKETNGEKSNRKHGSERSTKCGIVIRSSLLEAGETGDTGGGR